MARSSKKPVAIDISLLNKIFSPKYANRPIETYSRRSTIIPEMVGKIFGVHNGHKFLQVLITEDMVWHKLGEFSQTRKFPVRKDDKVK